MDAVRSMRAGTLVPATLDSGNLTNPQGLRSMRAGTLVPATPGLAGHRRPTARGRSMRAGTLVPATPFWGFTRRDATDGGRQRGILATFWPTCSVDRMDVLKLLRITAGSQVERGFPEMASMKKAWRVLLKPSLLSSLHDPGCAEAMAAINSYTSTMFMDRAG